MLPGPAPDSRPDLRLVPAAGACWAAVAWALAVPLPAVVGAAVAAAGITLVTAIALARRPRPAARRDRDRGRRLTRRRVGMHLVLACGALCATLSATGAALAVRGAGPIPRWVAQQAVADVVGRVVSDPHLLPPSRFDHQDDQRDGDTPRRYAVQLDVKEAAARGEQRRADARVLVLGDQSWSRVRVGSQVQVTGRFVPAEPGDDVAGLFRAFGSPQERAPPAWWWRAAEGPRQGLRDSVADRSPAPGGLLPSLVVGDTSLLTPAVEDDLRTSGLTHLTAVSGANVAIVTGSVLWLAVSIGLLRRARVTVAALALAGFVVLARPEPSVLRAAAMGTVMLAGLLSSRRSRGVPALAAAVLGLLLLDPWLARNAGFALSVVATGSLLLLAPPWAARLERVMPRPLALALAAPAAAQAACAPLLVLLEPSVSLVAVPANLLAGPAVLPATVLGVVAALLSVIWPGGAELVAGAGCLAAWWITEVAARASAVPGAQIGWLPGVFGAALLTLLTAAAVVVSLRLSARTEAVPTDAGPTDAGQTDADQTDADQTDPARTEGRWRPVTACVTVLLVVLAGWWLAGSVRDRTPTDWAVAMCDVGQGDAMVVRSGPDRAVLVDAGPEPAPVRRCLDDLGVRGLDLVVLTHFHADHVRGLSGALAGRQVGPVVVSPLNRPVYGVEAVDAAVASVAPGVTTRVVTDPVSGVGGSGGWALRWQVTHVAVGDSSDPSGLLDDPYSTSDSGSTDSGEGTLINDASLVMLLEQTSPAGVRLRVIGLGDLEQEGQSRLLHQLNSQQDGVTGGLDLIGPVDNRAGDDRVDVVKVAHHGSARQDPALYRRLGASLALIGVGADNDYGHPTPSALRMLSDLGATVVRTDRDGSIAVSARRVAGVADSPRLRLTVHHSGRLTGMARLLPTWFTAGPAGERAR